MKMMAKMNFFIFDYFDVANDIVKDYFVVELQLRMLYKIYDGVEMKNEVNQTITVEEKDFFILKFKETSFFVIMIYVIYRLFYQLYFV